MKNLFYLFSSLFLFAVITISCSNESGEELEGLPSTESIDEIEPYISPKMAETIAFLDTCTSVVPIEQLLPVVDTRIDEISSGEGQLSARSTVSESYTGKTSQKFLFTDKLVSISKLQITNWNSVYGDVYLTAGNYYLTAIAVYWQKIDDRQIYKSYDIGRKMGVDPDDDTAIGYNLQTIAPDTYLFTSYVYALRENVGDEYMYLFIPTSIIFLYDNFTLTWNYLAVSSN